MRSRGMAVVAMVLALAGCGKVRTARAQGPRISEIEMRPENTQRLVRGLYPAEGVWRWTAPSFAVSLDRPEVRGNVFLVLEGATPGELLPDAGSKATISARVNGVDVGEQVYSKIGPMSFTREVPAELLRRSPALVEFTVTPEAQRGSGGERRGMIALKVGFYEETRTPEFRDRIWNAGRAEYRRIYGDRPHGFTVEQDAALMKLFHDLRIWDRLQIIGVPILKNPLDLWMVQQVIEDVRPDFIIETGTFRGGSALFWAHTLDGLGLRGSKILTVDIGDYTQAAAAQKLWRRYVAFWRGSSTDDRIVNEFARMSAGKKVMVALDSNHEAAHVLAELKAYAPMVSRGSYLIVEDTHLDGVPTQPGFGPGPFAAVTEFLAQGGSRDFERDFSREGFGTSFNPGGWLRRK